jgi:phosphoenolpyruvate carboxykinase (GTP)
MEELTKVDAAGWKAEADGVAEFYGKFGAKLPAALAAELESLKKRLG